MPAIVLFVVALMVIVLESVFLGSFSIQNWALQTPLAVTIYLALDREFVPAGILLALLCFPVELLVGGVYGVYSLGLVAVFFCMRTVRGKIQSVWGVARGIVAAVAATLHGVVMMVSLFFVGGGAGRLPAAVGWQMGTTVLTVAVLTVVLGKGFARLDEMMDPRRGKNGLEF